MSETQNKTILELTPLNRYQQDDAIPVQRPTLNQDNCIALGSIIWYNENTKRLTINGAYTFDMSSLLPTNLSITFSGDIGIIDFTYNNQNYAKGDSIESTESQLSAVITANVNPHYTFNKWYFNNQDISRYSVQDYPNVLNYTFRTGGTLSASTTPKKYTISVNTDDSSWGTVSGGGSYNYNSSCTITATANEGYKFVRWTKNGTQVSTIASFTFNVTEDATYKAFFEKVEEIPTYYVGFMKNVTPPQFEAMSDSELISSEYAGPYNTPIVFAPFIGNICYVLFRASNPPKSGTLVSSGFTTFYYEQDFVDGNDSCPHEDIYIEGVRYKVWALYYSTWNSSNSITINFKN